MKIALIADTFPPLRSSGAVQLWDLSREFVRQGHSITVITPSPELKTSWSLENMEGVQVLRLQALKTKDVGYVRRAIGEILMPFLMLNNLHKSPVIDIKFDGVVWYSPTIFIAPVAAVLKKRNKCRAYLIVRDIFPEWAVDIGIMRPGLVYRFFKFVANYQYSVADVIGIQSPGNYSFFEKWDKNYGKRVEVLHNWLADLSKGDDSIHECSIDISKTNLAGRKIFVYAGNMGVAQGIDIFIKLAALFRDRGDVGFLFVGRGNESDRLAIKSKTLKLDNVVFHEEIHPDEIPALYKQCHVGLVSLDPRHKTHNIPGKFLSYMRSGLPVLANINKGNDLANLIVNENVGRVCFNNNAELLKYYAEELLAICENDSDIRLRCRQLYMKFFMPNVAVDQIVSALSNR